MIRLMLYCLHKNDDILCTERPFCSVHNQKNKINTKHWYNCIRTSCVSAFLLSVDDGRFTHTHHYIKMEEY